MSNVENLTEMIRLKVISVYLRYHYIRHTLTPCRNVSIHFE